MLAIAATWWLMAYSIQLWLLTVYACIVTYLFFLLAGCRFCRPTNSVKALKATSAFGLGRRR